MHKDGQPPDCYRLSVFDGKEFPVSRSHRAKATFEAMFSTDEDYLFFYGSQDKYHKRLGWVRFVYGNCGWEVIGDYTVVLEELLYGATMLAEWFERSCN